MNYQQIAELEKKVLVPTYDRLPFLAVGGEGCYLIDDRGRRYLDFLGGLAVNSLGYGHPELMAVVRDETQTLLHVSNLIYHPYQALVAEKLAQGSGLDRVFFGNSGSEVTEGAIKLARAYARKRQHQGRHEILAVENSFHGRTLGALAATWPEKYRKPFEPLVPGVRFVRLNDVNHLRECFTPQVAGVLVETIQGEGGIVKISEEFLKTAQSLANQNDALLISDEIQCGLGRTGSFFAYQKFGLKPDVVLVAKPLGGGLPLAAFITWEEVAQAFSPGMHGTTFGGGPLQCRLALKVLEIIERPGFLDHVRETGAYFLDRLKSLRNEYPELIREVRGEGLMVAAELTRPGKSIVQQALQVGVLMNCTQENVLRFLPPLIIENRHVDELMAALDGIFAGILTPTPQEAHA